jgi:phytoene dehydrogenase-like protein
LASAIRLAVSGWKVQVFEANDYPGGKLAQKKLGLSVSTLVQAFSPCLRM